MCDTVQDHNPNKLTVRFLPARGETGVAPGVTLLEAARQAGLPLGSSCDGDGICGFCRVLVVSGAECLSRPDEREVKCLIKGDGEPNERLACLARVFGPVSFTTTYW